MSACDDRSPTGCWSTDLLRVQINGKLYDFPALARPTPYPRLEGQVVTPRYDHGIEDGVVMLTYCQRPDAVPLQADAVRFMFDPGLAEESLRRVSGTIEAQSPRRQAPEPSLTLEEARSAVFVRSRSPEGIDRVYYRFQTKTGEVRREVSCAQRSNTEPRMCKSFFSLTPTVQLELIFQSAADDPLVVLNDAVETTSNILALFEGDTA